MKSDSTSCVAGMLADQNIRPAQGIWASVASSARDRVHVQPIIDRHLAAGLGPARCQRFEEWLARLGFGKVDHRRRPAAGGGDGAGVEIVAGGKLADRHLEVDVLVDGAGQDQHPRCVYRLAAG
jgi:hypothetical protein